MAYAQDEKSIRFGEDEILTNKVVAAYGFNALLDIDARHPRIEEHLCKLWCLQVEENWSVNTAFLLRRAARIRDETALIYRVLQELKKDDSLWEKIEKELKQPWSQKWFDKLAVQAPPRRKEVRKREQEKEVIGKHKAYPDLLEVWREDVGVLSDNLYHFRVGGRMHPSSIDYLNILDRFLEALEVRSKIKLIDSPKVYEEIEHGSKVG